MKRDQPVLSPRQFFFIIISFIIGSASLFVPEIIAGKDAWISTILSTLIGAVILLIIVHLQNKFKGLTIVEYSELLLGKLLGKLLSTLFIFNAFLISLLIIEDLVILFGIAIIPGTPHIVYRSGIVLLVAYAIYSGIESIGRLAELYVFPIIILLLFLPLLTIHLLDFTMLLPVLSDGIKPVIAGSIASLTFPFAEVAMLAMILPAVTSGPKNTSYFILGYFLAGGLLTIRTIVAISIFSADVVGKLQLPIFQVYRLVAIGEFLNRIEGLFIFIWILGFFTKLMASLYGVVLGIGQIFNMKDKQSLIIPVSLLVIFISGFMFPSTVFFVYFDIFILPFITISMNILFPLLLLVLSFFYNNDTEEQDEDEDEDKDKDKDKNKNKEKEKK